jgi:hypothetical protein
MSQHMQSHWGESCSEIWATDVVSEQQRDGTIYDQGVKLFGDAAAVSPLFSSGWELQAKASRRLGQGKGLT